MIADFPLDIRDRLSLHTMKDISPIHNRFKAALKKGQKQYGIWNGIPHSYAAEILAGAGFDWVLIDAEHGPFSMDQIIIQVQAMSRYAVSPILRMRNADPIYMKPLLDAGLQSFIIPMVESGETAEMMAQAMRYAPEGNRGVGTALARAAKWNRVNNYFKEANDQMCLITQVESMKGVEALDDILAVKEVDVVFMGPADLAATMGHLGNPGHPEVKAQVNDCLKRIVKAGKTPGVLTSSKELIADYTDKGARMIGVGLDTIILAKATKELAEYYKPELKADQSNTTY